MKHHAECNSSADQQDTSVKAKIDTVRYSKGSDVVSKPVRERQIRERETPEEIAAIRAALIEAERSVKLKGCRKKSIEEIWEEAKAKYRARHG